MPTILEKMVNLLGPVPQDKTAFIQKMRIHQGWWRTAVLCEEAGARPGAPTMTVCNTIKNTVKDGERSKNFIPGNAWKAYTDTIKEREGESSGLINKERAENNLLSSQPLCFNFFGELKEDPDFAASVLRNWFPNLQKVKKVCFEYGLSKDAFDKSAFDVAVLFETDQGKGLLGLECKYTDDFSPVATKPEKYKQIYERSKGVFSNPSFESYFTQDYNQLFRNQLILEELKHRKEIDFGMTGIFCHHDDEHALEAARAFQHEMLTDGQSRFQIITYKDYISAIQQGNISWEQREWLMLLWARYCGIELSREIRNKLTKDSKL